MLLLAKCYDKKQFMSPYNWVIYPLTQPQVANQQQKKNFCLPFPAIISLLVFDKY